VSSGSKELIFGNTLVHGNEELFYLWETIWNFFDPWEGGSKEGLLLFRNSLGNNFLPLIGEETIQKHLRYSCGLKHTPLKI
jgi:hypothetical protein